MEHELWSTLALAEGYTPPGQPGSEHGSSVEEQLADAKTRTQQWQVKRVVTEATKPTSIGVTDLTGATIKVEASLDTSVDALRALVHDQTRRVDPDLQMLLVNNEIPMKDETLALGAYGLHRGLRIQLTPQDPTKAATWRKLRHEGRKAAEQRAEAEPLALAKRRATQKKMACLSACAACVVGMVLLIMNMFGHPACGGLDCPTGYAGTLCDLACDNCSTDAIALLALMGTASVSSWNARTVTAQSNAMTEPCGEGWNEFSKDWHGIKCDREGGSVVELRGSEAWSGAGLEAGSVVPQGDLCALTPLVNLAKIHLGSTVQVSVATFLTSQHSRSSHT
jgi:hypothetical protein